jgi:hypothetical protein
MRRCRNQNRLETSKDFWRARRPNLLRVSHRNEVGGTPNGFGLVPRGNVGAADKVAELSNREI